MDKKSLLEWYIDAGVDEAVDDTPTDQFALSAAPAPAPREQTAEPVEAKPAARAVAMPAQPVSALQHSPSAAMAAARQKADAAQTIAELEHIVREFDGCALKRTASKTVFADGNPKASLMIIGEAPGVQEDLQGIPFCGESGQLLDRMLNAIGMDRSTVYISNTLFWRPPGNRQPSPEETAICLPFVEKHIALVKPKLLLLCGGTATATLLRKNSSISRLRGQMYEYQNSYLTQPLPCTLIFHPAYLLRTPLQKKLAWMDLLMIRDFLQKN